MNKIKQAFAKNGKPQKAFIAFLTGGDPSLEKTEEYILTMAAAGADLIEIGIPFSDPVAEGRVIQDANTRALAAGTTPEKLFALVAKVRPRIAAPCVFLTYLNPVFNYGYEKFFARAEQVGLDGVIIPDLPFEEKAEVAAIAAPHNVDIISLIAPTSEQRIEKIARAAAGFIYVVSSLGVTGVRSEIKTDLTSIIQVIRRAAPNTPVAVGFGISTPEQARVIGAEADGVIVGSAIVKIIAAYGDNAAAPLKEYVQTMKQALLECGGLTPL